MSKKPEINTPGKGISFWLRIAAVPLSYFLAEAFAALLLRPTTGLPLAFGLCWAAILSAITLCLPRLPGRIFYGLTYFFISLWTIAQTGYDQMFSKLMWLTDIRYAAEGAGYINVLLGFSWLWWISIPILITAGVLNIIHLPQWRRGPWSYSLCGLAFAGSILGLCLLPQAIYMRDNGVWGTHSEYGQSTSARANYRVMYDAQNVYDLCGIYQLTVKDVWKHSIYPLTPAYRHPGACPEASFPFLRFRDLVLELLVKVDPDRRNDRQRLIVKIHEPVCLFFPENSLCEEPGGIDPFALVRFVIHFLELFLRLPEIDHQRCCIRPHIQCQCFIYIPKRDLVGHGIRIDFFRSHIDPPFLENKGRKKSLPLNQAAVTVGSPLNRIVQENAFTSSVLPPNTTTFPMEHPQVIISPSAVVILILELRSVPRANCFPAI